MTNKVIVTRHAIDRARERSFDLSYLSDDELIQYLRDAALTGPEFGGGCVLGQKFIAANGVVLLVQPDRDNPETPVVRTVLTPEEARNAGGFRPLDVEVSYNNLATLPEVQAEAATPTEALLC